VGYDYFYLAQGIGLCGAQS